MKNNTSFFEKQAPKIIFWGICFILFLPIIIFPPSFGPSEWSRTLLFRTALTILTSFLLFKYFYKNDISISLPRWKVLDYLPLLLLLGFVLFVIISAIFSQDPRFSFFSSPARAGGSLNLLFYFVFSIILALFIKDKNWEKLWNINFFVASLASLLAIVQSFNLLKNVFISYEGGATPSFLGNSTFLAIYMLFMAIWSFVLFLQKREKKQKLIYGGFFLLFVLTIFLTGSRATYLALLVSFFFFLFLYPIRIKQIKTLKIIAGSLLLIAIISIIVFNSLPQLSEKGDFFSRLANRLSIQRVATDLFGTRFAVWQITLKAIKDRPLLGWGPENFYIGFEKYYEPTAPNLQKLWWDRPHNIFLDIAANSGLIALFFYIAFWLILLWSLQRFKYAKQREAEHENTQIKAHGLQTMFIGYLTALIFNFDSFSTYLISFFFIGYSFYLLSSGRGTVEIKNSQKIVNYKNKKAFTGFFAVILLLFLFFWNIKPLYINESVVYAKNLSNIKKCNKALMIIEEANKNPGILKAYNALIYTDIIKRCVSPEQEVEYAKKGLDSLKKASAVQPTWSRTWIFMGALNNVLAAKEENPENKNKLLEESKNYLNKALELSPKRQEILIEMEKNYLVAEDYQAMKKTAYDCINIDSSQGICYWYLGIPEIFLGDQESGKKHIQKSLEIGGFPIPYIQLGAAYIRQNNYRDAADAYHMLTTYYPENANYHAVMAFLSREIGDYARAGVEAEKVISLEPNNPEVEQFVAELLRLDPQNPTVHASMAYIYQQVGQKEKAKKELQAIVSIFLNLISENPDDPDYRIAIANVYKELGEYEKVYEEALAALKLEFEYKDDAETLLQTLPDEFMARYYVFIREYEKSIH